MKFQKRLLMLFLLLAISITMVTGCGGADVSGNPKGSLEDALVKFSEVKSYNYTGSFTLNLDVDDEALITDPEAAEILNILNSSVIKFRGAQSLEPFQAEFELSTEVNYQGLKIAIDIPIIMNSEALWIKVPEFLKEFDPTFESLSGYYLELNYEELAEMSGEEFPDMVQQTEAQMKLQPKLIEALIKPYEKDFFSYVKTEDITLPTDVDTKDIVKFSITDENLPTFITIAFDEVFPKMIDILVESDLYKDVPELQEELNNMKAELPETKAEVLTGIEENKDQFTINTFDILFGIKDGMQNYQAFQLDTTVDDGETAGKINIQGHIYMTNINQEPEFSHDIPSEEESLSLFQLMSIFMGAY